MLCTLSSIELYDILKLKFGEKEAKSLVTFVENEVESKLEKKAETLATKEYVRAELSVVKAELIKWMFIFTMGQMIAQAGIIVAVLKLFFR